MTNPSPSPNPGPDLDITIHGKPNNTGISITQNLENDLSTEHRTLSTTNFISPDTNPIDINISRTRSAPNDPNQYIAIELTEEAALALARNILSHIQRRRERTP